MAPSIKGSVKVALLHRTAPNIRAQLRIPLWKRSTPNVLLGGWSALSSHAKPIRVVG